MKRDNTREIALDLLLEEERGGGYGGDLIKGVLQKYDYLEGRDKAFIKRLAEGVIERRIQLDYVLEQFSKVPVVRMKPLIRTVLRMGAYQILFMDSVPDAAACNEAVKLAEKRHFQSLKGFVNGVLRSVSRNRDALAWPEREKDAGAYLSVRYSMPSWIVGMWMEDYGEQKTERILEGLLESRPLTIRLSEKVLNRTDGAFREDGFMERLCESGTQVERHPYLPYAYKLSGADGVAYLPGFQEGLFTVQDVSGMLVTECAGLDEEKDVALLVDVCAAPGGKATHAAGRLAEMGNGRVLARDLSETKVNLLLENARRLQCTNMKAEVGDACVLDESLIEKADIVFADLPCSGLGVIGRKPDIKYRITPESLEELALLQSKILDTVWRYVKPGGLLIYSTCTIDRKENGEIADWFLQNHPFVPEGLNRFLPEELRREEAEKGRLQLLPGIDDADGFFIARFRRRE